MTVRPFARRSRSNDGKVYEPGMAGRRPVGDDDVGHAPASSAATRRRHRRLRPPPRWSSFASAAPFAPGDRQVRHDGPVVGPEHGRRDLADRLRGHGQVALEHPVDEPRVVEQRRVHREPVGALLDPLEGAELVGLDERPGPDHLVVRDELAPEPLELVVEGRLDPLDRDARPGRRPARRRPTRRR